MLLMVEKIILGVMFHAVHRHAKANNKYVKDYHPTTVLSCFVYWDANNLYGWVKS